MGPAKKKKAKPPGGKRPAGEPARLGSPPTFARPWFAALLVFLVSVALYANTLGHSFVWDDYDLIVDNSAVKTLDLSVVSKIFRQDLWTEARASGRARLDTRHGAEQPYYRPLVTLSYHVDYKLFGGDPAGFHAINVIAYAATCTLAFAFLYALFSSVPLAAVTALLFAAHPVHTEAVAWISGRTDVFATLWSLASLYLYVLARRAQKVWLLLLSLVAFLFALLCKEIAVSVPLLVALMELGPFNALFATGHQSPSRRGLDGRVLRIAAFVGTLALYFVLKGALIGAAFSSNYPLMPGVLGRVTVPLALLAAYIYKAVLPITLTAVFMVPVPTSVMSPLVGAGAVLAALIVWAGWHFRGRSDVILGIGLFILGLAPVLHVIPIGSLSAERFLFFPTLGLTLILGGLCAGALGQFPALTNTQRARPTIRMPRALAAALVTVTAVVFVVFATQTILRNPDWRDNDTLFGKTAEQSPRNLVVLRMLATNAHRKGDIEGATWAYERMVEVAPDNASPHWNLGLIRMQQGNSVAARAHFVEAAKGGRDYRAAYYHIAVIDRAAGNIEGARENARRFLSLYDKDDRYRREAETIAGGE